MSYYDDEPLECLDDHGDGTCSGPVEMRWPGYGERSWPRCEKHGEERIEKAEETKRRYPQHAPDDFDPSYAGERWDDDY